MVLLAPLWTAVLLITATHLTSTAGRTVSWWNTGSSSGWLSSRSGRTELRGGAHPGHDDESSALPELLPSVDLPEQWAPGPKKALVFMDKFCPYFGYYMTRMATEVWGVACINAFSDYMKGYFLKNHPGEKEPLTMCRPDRSQLEEWLSKLPGIDEIVGVICESDSGLADAELFAQLLNVQHHNGINEARRNKFLMNQAVSKAGLTTVRQNLCRTVEDAAEFAKELGVNLKDHTGQDDKNPFINEQINGEPINGESGFGSSSVPEEDMFSNRGILGRGLNTAVASRAPMCVVKPVRGAASDSVFLCKDLSSVRRGFEVIHGSTIFGSPRETHDTVLVQEFAAGTEYALDIVSRDGEHKVAALWRYDKRPANGAPFVYHATEMIDGNTQEARRICEYAKNTLDALDLKWGLTHTEVITSAQWGPRLVEVNCRQHNTDFAPLAMACLGYNALDMTLAAYLGGRENVSYEFGDERERLNWDGLPDLPVTRAYGAIVHLVSSVEGRLVEVNTDALDEIQDMESVLDMEVYPSFLEVGSEIGPTVDIQSDAGWVQIINDDKDSFIGDYERIVELMPTLFIVE